MENKEFWVLASVADRTADALENGYSVVLHEQLKSLVVELEEKAEMCPNPEIGAKLGEIEAKSDRWEAAL